MSDFVQNEFVLAGSSRIQSSARNPDVVRSVYSDQTHILKAIQRLHLGGADYQCDITYGNGAFWKKIAKPGLCFDISPQKRGVQRADFKALPLEPGTLDNVVFDPPFLTYIKGGRNHKGGNVAMSRRFGGYYTYAELEDDYRHAISECYRVLAPKGVLVFKCQDIIHNHRMHCTHARVINMAEMEGFRILDLFILAASHRMPGPQKGKQRHARIFHSYFLVFKKQ